MMQRLLPFITLIVLFVGLAIASPNFLTATNLSSVVRQTAVINIIALGMTAVIASGGIAQAQGRRGGMVGNRGGGGGGAHPGFRGSPSFSAPASRPANFNPGGMNRPAGGGMNRPNPGMNPGNRPAPGGGPQARPSPGGGQGIRPPGGGGAGIDMHHHRFRSGIDGDDAFQPIRPPFRAQPVHLQPEALEGAAGGGRF